MTGACWIGRKPQYRNGVDAGEKGLNLGGRWILKRHADRELGRVGVDADRVNVGLHQVTQRGIDHAMALN